MNKPLSYSRMKMFITCPKQYEFRLMNKPQTDLPIYMAMGKYAHKFFEAYAQQCKVNNTRQMLDSVDSIAEKAYALSVAESIRDGEPLLLPNEWLDVLEKQCRPWAERTALPVEAIVSLELRWAADMNGEPVAFDATDAWLRGICDRVEVYPETRTCRVVDYKTGWAGHGDEMQADIYAWAMLADISYEIVEIVFEHTAIGKEEVRTYTRHDMERVDTAIRSLAQAIHETETFTPLPGTACLTCPYARFCDAVADVQEVIATEEDARKTVEALALLDRDMKTLKQALRTWCENHGPIEHNGVAWGIWRTPGEGFHDPHTFVEACEAHDIDPLDYMSVNNTKAKKLRKILPDLVTENPTERFAQKKATD